MPDVETIKIWAAKNEIPGTLSVLCADERVKTLILEEITKLGKQARLKSFEQVRHYAILQKHNAKILNF